MALIASFLQAFSICAIGAQGQFNLSHASLTTREARQELIALCKSNTPLYLNITGQSEPATVKNDTSQEESAYNEDEDELGTDDSHVGLSEVIGGLNPGQVAQAPAAPAPEEATTNEDDEDDEVVR